MTDEKYMDYEGLRGESEADGARHLLSELKGQMVPDDEILQQLGLFMTTQNMCRILFMMEMYKRVINVPGVVVEFGTRYGQNMVLFTTFRNIYDPYNFQRRIIGFDTFTGFPSVNTTADGAASCVKEGNYATPKNYSQRLKNLIAAHEQMAPLPHILKSEVIEGDVTETLDKYLTAHPELIISLAYFDMDIYEPTKHCLERVLPLMPKGAVLGFDELNHPSFPGETRALMELLDLRRLKLERVPYTVRPAFCVID